MCPIRLGNEIFIDFNLLGFYIPEMGLSASTELSRLKKENRESFQFFKRSSTKAAKKM